MGYVPAPSRIRTSSSASVALTTVSRSLAIICPPSLSPAIATASSVPTWIFCATTSASRPATWKSWGVVAASGCSDDMSGLMSQSIGAAGVAVKVGSPLP